MRIVSKTELTKILPLGSLYEEMQRDPMEPIRISRFTLRPHDEVPEGEVWLVPPGYLRSL